LFVVRLFACSLFVRSSFVRSSVRRSSFVARHSSMLILRARWVLPIAERPVRNGWVALERGRVAALGRAGASLPFKDDSPLVDLGPMAVMPALVNAHTHLELAWMAGRVAPAKRFTDWVRELLRVRRAEAPAPEHAAAAVEQTIAAHRASGTGLVGEVSNTLDTVAPLRRSALGGVVFHELLRLNGADADAVLDQGLAAVKRCGPSARVPVSLAPHAPYSVSPQLFQGIRSALARMPFLPSTVHLGESPEEIELLDTGQGPWRRLLEELGAWDPAWQAPGCRPVEYLARMRVLGPKLLVVHGTQFDARDLARVAASGATLVACPRSNVHVGVGPPPVEWFYRSGAPVAIGTDSLASVPDVNLFEELAALRRLAPQVPAGRLLESATKTGAAALGFESEAGTIEPGRASALIAVDLPADLVDVEEYLVGGLPPDRVHWVGDLLGDLARYA
jgi:aminodeoxyfutalosine deaminase